jgi:hypothetical protein
MHSTGSADFVPVLRALLRGIAAAMHGLGARGAGGLQQACGTAA